MIETAGTVADTFGTREKAERELKKLQARYERRGITARNQLERDVKKARTRLERVVRRNRTAVERDASRRNNVVTGQLAGVSGRVEDVVQVGVAAASASARSPRSASPPSPNGAQFPPRAAGEAAPRVTLPASYPAGRTGRHMSGRRVQHSLPSAVAALLGVRRRSLRDRSGLAGSPTPIYGVPPMVRALM